jgi:Hypervirulence associated proteins TUDOR domain
MMQASPSAIEVCMSEKFRAGDPVEWNSHGSTAKGKVQKKLTSRTTIKGHLVAASPDNPEYLVETGSGGVAAHKPDALRKITDPDPESAKPERKKA